MDLKGTEIRNLFKLCDLFDKSDNESDNTLFINIPHYQRPYLWEIKHIKMLLEDFYEYYKQHTEKESTKNKYFAGSIVSVRTKPEDRVGLIDGQQRITTLFLIGYLKYIINREVSKIMITENMPSLINEYVGETAMIYRSLIKKDDSLESKVKQIKKLGEKIDQANPQDKSKIVDERKNEFRKAFGVPSVTYDDMVEYSKCYVDETEDLFGDENLNLSYSRKSLNSKLKRALERVSVVLDSHHGPKLYIYEDDTWKNDEAIKKYTEVIKIVFDEVESRLKNEDLEYKNSTLAPYEKAVKIKNSLDALIRNTSFCVIETGNTSDAYKLFEVLNDRALALDDLDLLKNLYYKEYCEGTSDDTEQVDKNIEELEKLWSDSIYISRDWTKDIISYAGTAYISGKSSQLSKNENKRAVIEKYLKGSFSDSYTFEAIKQDFVEYHKVRLIIETYGLKSRYSPELIIESANNNYSITYKTLHLTATLRQYGVFAGLSNIVLRTFKDTHNCDGGKDYMVEFTKYLEDIRKAQSHSNDNYKKMHQIAQKLWQTVMLSEDFTKAKEISDDIISKVSRSQDGYDNLMIQGAKDNELLQEFEDWVKKWRYGKSSDIKIRLLLARAINFTMDDNKLVRGSLCLTATEGTKFELDHLESVNLDETWKTFYFKNTVDDAIALNCLNQIGNFLLLEEGKNKGKSNVPIDHADSYYKKMGLYDNHWLRKDLDELLEEHSEKKQAGNETIRIPRKEFFEERTERMINRFREMISYNDVK